MKKGQGDRGEEEEKRDKEDGMECYDPHENSKLLSCNGSFLK